MARGPVAVATGLRGDATPAAAPPAEARTDAGPREADEDALLDADEAAAAGAPGLDARGETSALAAAEEALALAAPTAAAG